MPRVDVSHAMDPRLRTLLGHFERARVTPHFVQLTLDIQIPIVLCVLHDATGGRPVLAVGAAANLDPVRAACKAAEESAHTRQWVGSMHATKRGKVYAADFRNVSDFEDHVWLFESPEMAAHAAFLYSGRPIVPLESLSNGSTGAPASDLDVARRRVEQAGFDVLHKDMTTPDVRECGLAVHRTYIPGLQNINGPHLWRLLGGRRLYELPVTLGLRQTPLTEAELNPIPHPFP
jgi:ribosomal protein S12 methylthiotransferase accessory factor